MKATAPTSPRTFVNAWGAEFKRGGVGPIWRSRQNKYSETFQGPNLANYPNHSDWGDLAFCRFGKWQMPSRAAWISQGRAPGIRRLSADYRMGRFDNCPHRRPLQSIPSLVRT